MHARGSFASSPREKRVSGLAQRRQLYTHAAGSSKLCAVGPVSQTTARSSAVCAALGQSDTRESSVGPWVLAQLTMGRQRRAQARHLPILLSATQMMVCLTRSYPSVELYATLVQCVLIAADSGNIRALRSGLLASRGDVSVMYFHYGRPPLLCLCRLWLPGSL